MIQKFLSKKMLKYAVSLSVLALLFYHMDMHALFSTFESLSLKAFVCAIGLGVVQIFVMNLRWHEIMSVGTKDIPFHTNSLVNILGFFAGLFFLTSVGQVVTKYAFAVRFGMSYMRALFATCLDRFLTLFSLVFLSALSLPFVTFLKPALFAVLSLSILGLVISVVMIVVLLRLGVFRSFILSSRRRVKFVAIMRSYLENYPLMLKTAFYSLSAHICYIFMACMLSQVLLAPEETRNVVEFIAIMPVLALIASLPISIGGWGVREGTFVIGLGAIGYSMEAAFSLSVQIGVAFLIAHCIMLVPYILKQDMRILLQSKRGLFVMESGKGV